MLGSVPSGRLVQGVSMAGSLVGLLIARDLGKDRAIGAAIGGLVGFVTGLGLAYSDTENEVQENDTDVPEDE